MTPGGRSGDEVVVVLCTAPPAEPTGTRGASALAQQLVEERLCACVNVIAGATSWFRWEGKVERAEEHLLVIKTTRAACDRLRQRLLELHPYQVPEVLVLDTAGGHAAYLAWVAASVRPDSAAPDAE